MVFGVFDGIHEGHRALFSQAKKLGDYLIAVTPPDQIIQQLKGHLPKINLEERMEHLKKVDEVNEVAIGDNQLGVWEVVRKYKPDIIVLGYDQRFLKEDLEKHFSEFGYLPDIKIMESYRPEVYHSSILKSLKP
jgi:cytidyltransferase-like protein